MSERRIRFKGSVVDRLKLYSEPKPDGCIMWKSQKSGAGYGVIWVGGEKKQDLAHRISYKIHKGEIPEGFDVDHTCHKPDECKGGKTCQHRACINPDHLEAVTRRENSLRGHIYNRYKTHCPEGHPYDGSNLLLRIGVGYGFGYRYCRACAKNVRFRKRIFSILLRKNLWPRGDRKDVVYGPESFYWTVSYQ